MLSKWEPGGETAYAMRIVSPYDTIIQAEYSENVVWQVFDRTEVYYINQKTSEINAEKDYELLRKNGTLVWSGTLE